MIVDSHSHVSLSWYEPVESLLFQMDRNGVDKAVLVQMWNERDNTYQVECVQRFPDRFTSVVMVDVESPEAVDQLERAVAEGAKGVRLRPLTRSAGADPLALWRTAERLGINVSCVGAPEAFASEEFEAVIRELPGVPIIIEHIGELQPAADSYDPAVAERIFALSRYDNVYMKIHGLGEFAVRKKGTADGFPFVMPIPDLLPRSLKSFGANRLMWGSDYPPVSRREGYANSLKFVMQELDHISAKEKALIFGGTAAALYSLETSIPAAQPARA